MKFETRELMPASSRDDKPMKSEKNNITTGSNLWVVSVVIDDNDSSPEFVAMENARFEAQRKEIMEAKQPAALIFTGPLQRYNYALNLAYQHFLDLRGQGCNTNDVDYDQWLKSKAKSDEIEALLQARVDAWWQGKAFTYGDIINWNTFLQKTEFPERKQYFLALCDSGSARFDSKYLEAVNSVITQRLKNFSQIDGRFKAFAETMLKEYLIEEAAVISFFVELKTPRDSFWNHLVYGGEDTAGFIGFSLLKTKILLSEQQKPHSETIKLKLINPHVKKKALQIPRVSRVASQDLDHSISTAGSSPPNAPLIMTDSFLIDDKDSFGSGDEESPDEVAAEFQLGALAKKMITLLRHEEFVNKPVQQTAYLKSLIDNLLRLGNSFEAKSSDESQSALSLSIPDTLNNLPYRDWHNQSLHDAAALIRKCQFSAARKRQLIKERLVDPLQDEWQRRQETLLLGTVSAPARLQRSRNSQPALFDSSHPQRPRSLSSEAKPTISYGLNESGMNG